MGGVALAQGTVIFEQDHLKCYRVMKDRNPAGRHEVALLNRQFGEEKCKVSNKASYLCTPTDKLAVDGNQIDDDPRGFAIDSITDDYLCYRLSCQNPVEREVIVDDQFGQRGLVIRQAQLLCTPTRKIEPPPNIPCEQSGAPLCGGSCTSPLLKCTATPNGCFCLD
jgi:hypothetical protein